VAEVPDLNWLITAFTDRVPDVARAAVVSADGLPLACSRDFPPDRVDQLAAITSGLSGLTRGAARIFEGGPVVQSVVVMKQGLLMVRAVGHGAVLVVLAGADCDIGQVAYEMALFGEQAGSALSPAAHGLPPAGARSWPRRYTPGPELPRYGCAAVATSRACVSVRIRAIPTPVQPELSSISSRSTAAWYSRATGPMATRSDFSFFMISMKFMGTFPSGDPAPGRPGRWPVLVYFLTARNR
jgi:predicted regulator of Ras-like GTPase activity (Roadblock/LC7/MglB family)